MFCPKCEERLRDPMVVICPKCNYDLGDIDQVFIEKFDSWLKERVEAGEIDSYKAAGLLHLSGKPLRSVQFMDMWSKAPHQMESKERGSFARIKDTDIHISTVDGLDFFFGREYMNDPYIRLITRDDIPLLELDCLLKELAKLLLAQLESERPAMDYPDYSRGRDEYFDFYYSAEDENEFQPIPYRDSAFLQPIGVEFWENYRDVLLSKLQPYLNDGWIPVEEIDYTCISMDERVDEEFQSPIPAIYDTGTVTGKAFFKGFHVRLRRPKKL